jgi:hypothetical protein
MKVEGVTYEVDWHTFKKGKSLFFPCLDPERARQQVADTIGPFRIKTVTKICIEDGIKGLRVWRV